MSPANDSFRLARPRTGPATFEVASTLALCLAGAGTWLLVLPLELLRLTVGS